MAKVKTGKSDNRVARSVIHGAIGTVPIGGAQYETYKAARTAGVGRGGSVGVAAAGTFVPFSGTAAGAYHGYHSKIFHGAKNMSGAHKF